MYFHFNSTDGGGGHNKISVQKQRPASLEYLAPPSSHFKLFSHRQQSLACRDRAAITWARHFFIVWYDCETNPKAWWMGWLSCNRETIGLIRGLTSHIHREPYPREMRTPNGAFKAFSGFPISPCRPFEECSSSKNVLLHKMHQRNRDSCEAASYWPAALTSQIIGLTAGWGKKGFGVNHYKRG